MAKEGGPGQKMTRAPRTNNTPSDDDAQTQAELEMASSGRDSVVPREGLVGAHLERREAVGAHTGEQDDLESDGESDDGMRAQGQEPVEGGSDVAPTPRAQERERERHRLERAEGRVAAGLDGQVRDRRDASVTREALDDAARRADEHVGAALDPSGSHPSGRR